MQDYTQKTMHDSLFVQATDEYRILWNTIKPKIMQDSAWSTLSYQSKLFSNSNCLYLHDLCVITGWLQEWEITGDGLKEVRHIAVFVFYSVQPAVSLIPTANKFDRLKVCLC